MSEIEINSDAAVKMIQEKIDRLMANKVDLRKTTAEREKAIGDWNSKIKDTVQSIHDKLILRNRELGEARFSALRLLHERLTEHNKKLFSSNLNFHETEEIRQIEVASNEDENLALPKLDSSFEEFNFSGMSDDLAVLRALLLEHDRARFEPIFSAKKRAKMTSAALNLNPEDSFYNLDKKLLGVHYYDGAKDQVLRAKADGIDSLDKSDLNAVGVNHEEVKATCGECGQHISVLLQIELAQKKRAEDFNRVLDDDSFNNNVTPAKSTFPNDGSSKKAVSFKKKTVILDVESVDGRPPTPKINEGYLQDNEHQRCTRSSLALRSPPLQDDNLLQSASKDFQRRLSHGEGSDKTSGVEEIKTSCIFGTKAPAVVKTYTFTYPNFRPTVLTKFENNLFVCSPTLKKVVVLDCTTGTTKGYLKLPNGQQYKNPRGICGYKNRILILDADVIHVFEGGVLLKSIFGDEAKNFRGLSTDSSVNKSQQHCAFTLEKKADDRNVHLVILDIENAVILNRIEITGSDSEGIACRFLAISAETAVITDMGAGKLFKVRLRDGDVKSVKADGKDGKDGKLKLTGVTFDPMTGNFAVATDRCTLEILNMEGTWIRSLEIDVKLPAGVLLDDDDLFVVNNKENVVNKYILCEDF